MSAQQHYEAVVWVIAVLELKIIYMIYVHMKRGTRYHGYTGGGVSVLLSRTPQ